MTRKRGSLALACNLAFLWFCCVHRPKRHRLLEKDLVDLFGRDTVYTGSKNAEFKIRLRGYHCLDCNNDLYRVLNVYAQGRPFPM